MTRRPGAPRAGPPAGGSVAAPLLLHALGVRATLALLGGGLTILALAHVRRFVRLDAAMPAPGAELGLLRRLAMFAPLPLAVIELLASDLEPHEYTAGAVVVRAVPPDRRRLRRGQRPGGAAPAARAGRLLR